MFWEKKNLFGVTVCFGDFFCSPFLIFNFTLKTSDQDIFFFPVEKLKLLSLKQDKISPTHPCTQNRPYASLHLVRSEPRTNFVLQALQAFLTLRPCKIMGLTNSIQPIPRFLQGLQTLQA